MSELDVVWVGRTGVFLPPYLRARLREQEDTDRAGVLLFAATPLHLMDRVKAEVERREQLFADSLATGPSKREDPNPRRAALESVYDDVVKGRWR